MDRQAEAKTIPPRSHPPPGRARAEGEREMTRLQKFVEIGEGSCRHVYVLRPSSLPSADEGKEWYPVEKFNAADELLEYPSLKVVFKMGPRRLWGGCRMLRNGRVNSKNTRHRRQVAVDFCKTALFRPIAQPTAQPLDMVLAGDLPPT